MIIAAFVGTCRVMMARSQPWRTSSRAQSRLDPPFDVLKLGGFLSPSCLRQALAAGSATPERSASVGGGSDR